MGDEPPSGIQSVPDIRPVPNTLVALVLHSRQINVYPVSDAELKILVGASNDLALYRHLFGISISAFITLSGSLITTLLFTQFSSPFTLAGYVAVFSAGALVTGLGSIWAGFKGRAARREMDAAVSDVRAGKVLDRLEALSSASSE